MNLPPDLPPKCFADDPCGTVANDRKRSYCSMLRDRDPYRLQRPDLAKVGVAGSNPIDAPRHRSHVGVGGVGEPSAVIATPRAGRVLGGSVHRQGADAPAGSVSIRAALVGQRDLAWSRPTAAAADGCRVDMGAFQVVVRWSRFLRVLLGIGIWRRGPTNVYAAQSRNPRKYGQLFGGLSFLDTEGVGSPRHRSPSSPVENA